MEAHRLEHEDRETWRGLPAGQELTVVKRSPNGNEAARYHATLVARSREDDWIALRAHWTYKRVELDGLVFAPGDELIEWFSPGLPFNAFAVLSPAGDLRGWYANVTYPAYLEKATETDQPLTLVWHDLYLDLVGLPDGTFSVRDEDELEESGLPSSNPHLYREIWAAAHELIRRFASRQLPFRLVGSTNSA